MSTTTSGVTPTPSICAPPGETKRCSVTWSTEPSGRRDLRRHADVAGGLAADQRADLGFLNRGGENLGARSAVAVDQHAPAPRR